MFSYFSQKMRYYLAKKRFEESEKPAEAEEDIMPVSKSLAENTDCVKKTLGNAGDLIMRNLILNDPEKTAVTLVYIDGMIKAEAIFESIVRPLLDLRESTVSVDFLKHSVIQSNEIKNIETIGQMCAACLAGETGIFINGFSSALSIASTRGWERRAISEPQTETVIRGPRESFTEDFRINTSLIRRKIRSTSLRMDTSVVGKRSKTNICVCYFEDIADGEVVENIKKKLGEIDIDAALESGFIEQFLEERPFSIFNTIAYTEKPDLAVIKLLEGKVVVIVEGSPFVLTAPMVFAENMKTSEDYSMRTLYASFTRLLHYFAFFITTVGPGAFVAFTNFHQEMIPTTLLFTMISAREGIPFPSIIEAVILLLIFEVLREAGLRLPRPSGQAVSIVGALVMGEAAVLAGIVGAPMLIAIAITAVSGFVVPSLSDSIVFIRLLLLVLGSVLGGVGVMLGILALIIYLADLKSFGVPYMTPIAPAIAENLKDAIIRVPVRSLKKRPWPIASGDSTRQGDGKGE